MTTPTTGLQPPAVTSTTLGDLFGEIAAREPDALSYVEGDERMTYADWVARADSLAAELRARGVQPGDVLGVMLPSSIDYAVVYAAGARLGAVVTGINTRLGPTEITAILGRCEPVALVHEVDGDPIPQAHRPAVLMTCTEMKAAAAAGTPSPTVPCGSPTTRCASCGRVAPPASPGCVVRPPRVAGGRPAQRHPLRLPRRAARGAVRALGLHEQAVDQVEYVINCILMPVPWTPEKMLELMIEERVTGGQACPPSGPSSWSCPASPTPTSRRCASAAPAAPVTPELAEKLRARLGVPVVRYARTESVTVTGTLPDDPPEVLLHTVGRPGPGVELKLVDEEGNEVPRGDTGIVTLRSPVGMRGYWNDPERTAETRTDDGWITTSDLGMLRDDGNLVLQGRSSEMYIRGGYNVYPLEVERVLEDHPRVARAAVVGMPAPVIGEVGVAFVEATDPANPPTQDELRAFAKERMADYKAPDHVVVVDALPLTPVLKIDKRALKELAANTELTRS
ncbi:MAG: class I adenylate-forming enzyme family protein [Acidimicrobiia bacterium]